MKFRKVIINNGYCKVSWIDVDINELGEHIKENFKNYFDNVTICNIETSFIQDSMIPHVIVDIVHKERLKTLTIQLDKEKADAFYALYIEDTIRDSIEKYIIQFDKNNKKQ